MSRVAAFAMSSLLMTPAWAGANEVELIKASAHVLILGSACAKLGHPADTDGLMKQAVDDIALAGFDRSEAERQMRSLVAKEAPAIAKHLERESTKEPYVATYMCGPILEERRQMLKGLRAAVN